MNTFPTATWKVSVGMLAVTCLSWLAVPWAFAQNPVPEAPVEGEPTSLSAQPAVPATEEGEGTNHNAITLDVNGGDSYNDNIFSNNVNRVAGQVFSAGATLGFFETRSRFDVALSYSPSFLGYSNFSGFDQVNHNLSFRGTYRLTPHMNISLQDGTGYYRGIFEAPVAEPAPLNQPAQSTVFSLAGSLPGIAPTLNQTVYTPLVDEFTNSSRADITDRLSPNGTIDVFGTLEDLRFGMAANASPNTQENLFDTFGGSAGIAYVYRLSNSWVVAPAYSFQALEFGSFSQVAIHNAVVNVTWNLTPSLSISMFGGTQHVDMRENLAVAASFLPSNLAAGRAVILNVAPQAKDPKPPSPTPLPIPVPAPAGPSSGSSSGPNGSGGGSNDGGNSGSGTVSTAPTNSPISAPTSTSSSSSIAAPAPTTTSTTLSGLATVSTGLNTQSPAVSPGEQTDLVNWYPEYGAVITKNAGHFQFQFSGQHLATDGGGILTSVITTSESAGVRWDLSPHWQARWSVTNGSTLALSPVFSGGKIQAQDFGFALVHQISQRLNCQLSYDYAQQRVEGDVPFYVNLNRNLVSFTLSYRLADFPLGR